MPARLLPESRVIWRATTASCPQARSTPLPCVSGMMPESTIGVHRVAKKPNFGFEKRQKDLKKQQKREEKAEKKRLKREGGEPAAPEGVDELTPSEPEIAP